MAITLKSSAVYMSIISNIKTFPSAFIHIPALYLLEPCKSKEVSDGMKKTTNQRRGQCLQGFYYKIECQTKIIRGPW